MGSHGNPDFGVLSFDVDLETIMKQIFYPKTQVSNQPAATPKIED